MAGSSEPAFLFLRAKKELMLQQPFSYFCNSPSYFKMDSFQIDALKEF